MQDGTRRRSGIQANLMARECTDSRRSPSTRAQRQLSVHSRRVVGGNSCPIPHEHGKPEAALPDSDLSTYSGHLCVARVCAPRNRGPLHNRACLGDNGIARYIYVYGVDEQLRLIAIVAISKTWFLHFSVFFGRKRWLDFLQGCGSFSSMRRTTRSTQETTRPCPREKD